MAGVCLEHPDVHRQLDRGDHWCHREPLNSGGGVQRPRVDLEPDLAIQVRLTEQGALVRPEEESEIIHAMCEVCTEQLQGTAVTCGMGGAVGLTFCPSVSSLNHESSCPGRVGRGMKADV